jgi:predicted AlkP superfamily pyrophosphatase or phosphodiesterase
MRIRLTLAIVAMCVATTARAGPVLLISIDGLQPHDVLEAEARGLKIPNLRRFVKDGGHATGVRGVLPTVTYPSHATLLTGTAPARHGIIGNTTFDPMQINQSGWYWYARAIRVPTLWDAARKGGMTVGNVHWPVSVGAKSITWNLPQIWRTGHADDDDLVAALSTPDLLEAMEARLGKYAPGIDESLAGDETRGRFAVDMIAQRKPGFMTVYLTSLDHEQHEKGPDTAAAHAVLERIDAIVGTLLAAEMAAHPDATIALVSDHGLFFSIPAGK